MHGSITFKRSLIPWGFIARLELLLVVPTHRLGDFYTEIVREIIPTGALRGETITDLKGRDPHALLDMETPSNLLPRGEELFFVAGRTTAPEESLEEIIAETLTEPFDISIRTEFERFVGDHHIAHRTILERRGAAAEFLDIETIGCAWPLIIDRLRIGLEYFRSHRSGILGYTPTVERTLLIDATAQQIRIVYEHERLTTRAPEQLLADETVQALAGALNRGIGENLVAFIRSACIDHPTASKTR